MACFGCLVGPHVLLCAYLSSLELPLNLRALFVQLICLLAHDLDQLGHLTVSLLLLLLVLLQQLFQFCLLRLKLKLQLLVGGRHLIDFLLLIDIGRG